MRAGRRRAARRVRGALVGIVRRRGIESHVLRALRFLGPREWRSHLQDAEHFRLLCAFALRSDSNCIDVGASRGAALRSAVAFAPHGHHIAYEPVPTVAAQLRRDFPGVEVRTAALSDTSGSETFAWVKDLPSRSGLRALYHSSGEVEIIEVKVARLDDSLPDGYVPALIKIDVEGAERQVLAGALDTITRHKPLIVFEHDPRSARYYGTHARDLHELLCERGGLRIFGLDGSGPFGVAEFERQVAARRRWNFLAHE